MITRKGFASDWERLTRLYSHDEILRATLWWIQRGMGGRSAHHVSVPSEIESIVLEMRKDNATP